MIEIRQIAVTGLAIVVVVAHLLACLPVIVTDHLLHGKPGRLSLLLFLALSVLIGQSSGAWREAGALLA